MMACHKLWYARSLFVSYKLQLWSANVLYNGIVYKARHAITKDRSGWFHPFELYRPSIFRKVKRLNDLIKLLSLPVLTWSRKLFCFILSCRGCLMYTWMGWFIADKAAVWLTYSKIKSGCNNGLGLKDRHLFVTGAFGTPLSFGSTFVNILTTLHLNEKLNK